MTSPSSSKVDVKAWTQEIRSNRKTQAALLILFLVLAYLLWPSSAPQRRPNSATATPTISLDDPHIKSLDKLKDLTELNQAGELPDEGRMYRDVFVFDMPPPEPPPPPPPPRPPPPPPPPTPEELAAQKLAAERQEATNSKPQSLRYIGFMGRPSTGRIASFVKGEEVVSLRTGDMATPGWKLLAITEHYAEFENTRFPDIRFRAQSVDRQGGGFNPEPVNEF